MNLADFHWLRPYWLLALLPIVAVLVDHLRGSAPRGIWAQVCDPALLEFVLTSDQTNRRAQLSPWWFAVAGALSVLALAGPTWERLPQPVFRDSAALVVAFDLSRSMDAADLKPNRSTRARYKIADLVATRKTGQTALLAYASEAFVVTPLTDDTKTIAALLPALGSDIMPAQGSNAESAVTKAMELLAQANVPSGDILLVTDGVTPAHASAISGALAGSGNRLSILGVGNVDGAPIPLPDGGFVTNAAGAITITRLEEPNLRQLAIANGGIYQRLRPDDLDVRNLTNAFEQARLSPVDDSSVAEFEADQWRERGPWLLLLVLPMAAFAFRKGVLVGLAVVVLVPPPAEALDWKSLWVKPDRSAQTALATGDPETAAKLFEDPAWKGAARYRAGDFQGARDAYADLESATAHYNQGNALARLGDYQTALDSYDAALQQQPEHADALHNRALLEDLLKEQQPKDQQEQQSQRKQQPQNQQGEQQQPEQQTQPPDGSADSKQNEQPPEAEGSEQSADAATESESEQQADNSEQRDPSQSQDPSQDDSASEKESTKTDERRSAEQQLAEAELEQAAHDETEQESEQWLRRIPDDPGGLLRRKFLYQYRRLPNYSDSEQPW